jgi:hypothetical protein
LLWVFCSGWSELRSSYFLLLAVAGMTGMNPHSQLFFHWDRALLTFCPCPLIAQVAKIMGMSYCCPSLLIDFINNILIIFT